MKLLIPMILTLISLPLGAQETPAPAKPEPTIKESKAATSTSGKTYHSTSREKVVLPPKSTSKPSAKAPTPTSKTSSSTRPPSRRIVLPPASRTSSKRPATTSRVVPRSTSGSRTGGAGTSTSRPVGLQENITIQLKGSTQSGDALDLSLTGIGPIFQEDVSVGKESTILTHSYSIVPQGSSYLVEFSIGLRLRHLTSTSGQHKNYEFRDNMITGKVLLEAGKPVTVSNNQGKILELTILKP